MANEFPEATGRLRDPRSDPDHYQRLKETIDTLPDNLTDQEADAILREHGTSAKEVVNGFIEQLLRERFALQEAAEAALTHFEIRQNLLKRTDAPVDEKELALIKQLRAALHPQPQEKKS